MTLVFLGIEAGQVPSPFSHHAQKRVCSGPFRRPNVFPKRWLELNTINQSLRAPALIRDLHTA